MRSSKWHTLAIDGSANGSWCGDHDRAAGPTADHGPTADDHDDDGPTADDHDDDPTE